MMEYKGFKAQIDFDDAAGLFLGEVINSHSGINFQGRSVEELRLAFHAAVDGHLGRNGTEGAEPGRKFSGRLSIRLDPDLHRTITAAATRAGKPLTTWISERLGEAAARAEPRSALVRPPRPN
ncbi:MAG: toxin-antitoxin system HicB family antitoxin [Azospirillum sp.]|nr:toxin-antitoxin system HicB family antitoxin [Azospirillum sp.]